jgi:hypothetical protein
VYPKRFLSIFGHHAFRDLLNNQTLSNEDIQFFEQADNNFVLSSEDFISLNKDKFEYLRCAIESKQIEVIYSWRRASLKLYSIWQETVKHGGTQTFAAYYHDHLARPGMSQMLSADLKLNMFCHVFGRDNVKVLDYDASAANNSLLKDFISAVGLKWQDNFVTPENNENAINRSMDVTDIEVIRGLNQVFKVKHSITGAWVRQQYAALSEPLEQAGLAQLKQVISRYQRELTVGNYLIDNRGEKIMSDKFKDNLLNHQVCQTRKSIRLAEPEWIFETEAQTLMAELTRVLETAIA